MKFEKQKLIEYKHILETTQLQQGYQEFIKLFRYLRITLEKELQDFTFSGSIVENRMDFSYFQLLSPELKEKGIKLQIVFVHADFRFEVWISGYNRKIQCLYYDYLKDREIPYFLNSNPNTVDYIFKKQLSNEIDISESGSLINALVIDINKIVEFTKSLNIAYDQKRNI